MSIETELLKQNDLTKEERQFLEKYTGTDQSWLRKCEKLLRLLGERMVSKPTSLQNINFITKMDFEMYMNQCGLVWADFGTFEVGKDVSLSLDHKRDLPFFYLLKHGEELFFVDTEGYDYARYVLKLV
jgi:hypothetical protein